VRVAWQQHRGGRELEQNISLHPVLNFAKQHFQGSIT